MRYFVIGLHLCLRFESAKLSAVSGKLTYSFCLGDFRAIQVWASHSMWKKCCPTGGATIFLWETFRSKSNCEKFAKHRRLSHIQELPWVWSDQTLCFFMTLKKNLNLSLKHWECFPARCSQKNYFLRNRIVRFVSSDANSCHLGLQGMPWRLASLLNFVSMTKTGIVGKSKFFKQELIVRAVYSYLKIRMDPVVIDSTPVVL